MTGSGLAGADDDTQRLRETLAAAQSGDLARAAALADAALQDGLVDPLYFKLRAIQHDRSGRLDEAVKDFRSALAFAPEDHAALSALGLCLAKAGRVQEGLAALGSSIALQPGYAPAHCNRGWALEVAGERAAARSAYERALAIDPRNVQALGSLGVIVAQGGAPDQARDYASRALAISPHDAVANLALGMADVAAGNHQAAEARMRALSTDPRQPEHERAIAFTVLGDALDQAGRTAEAFAAYQSANAALLRLQDQQSGRDAAAGEASLAQGLAAYFESAQPSAWRRGPPAVSPSPARGHVFVVGFPRSGTTLLGQVLAAHPDCAVLDEQETLAEPAHALLTSAAGLDRLAAADADELEPFRQAYWRRVAAAAAVEGRVFVDKLPMNSLGLPLIAKLFPDARVISVRRDPRDVVLSCFRRQFALNAASREFLTLEGAARFYDTVMRLLELYQQKVELDLRVQRYEDLVTDFDGQSRDLCNFVGLEWTPQLSGFASAAAPFQLATPSAGQVARGLYGEGVGQWRRYGQELAAVLPTLAPWIERFGYPPD